ncbi:MAG: hypothetical protein ACTSQH_05740 [Candidatus Hodarchaeales archaeon]
MDEYEIEGLKALSVYCPKHIIQKYKHKHSKDKDWTRFYYYKNKKRLEVLPENIEYDFEVSSTLAYSKHVFYKMTTMSNSDPFFDFYFKLKPTLPKIVVKSSNRKSEKLKPHWKSPPIPPRKICPDTGRVIVTFP